MRVREQCSKQAGASAVGVMMLLVAALVAVPAMSRLGQLQARTIEQRVSSETQSLPVLRSSSNAALLSIARAGGVVRRAPSALHGLDIVWPDEALPTRPANWLDEAERMLEHDPHRIERHTPQLGVALAKLRRRHPFVHFVGRAEPQGVESSSLFEAIAIPIEYRELLRFVEQPNASRDAALAERVSKLGEYLDIKRGLAALTASEFEVLTDTVATGLRQRRVGHASVREMIGRVWTEPPPDELNALAASKAQSIIRTSYKKAGVKFPDVSGTRMTLVRAGQKYQQQPWHKDFGLAIISFDNPGTLFDPSDANRAHAAHGVIDVEQALPWTLSVMKPRTQHAAPPSTTPRRVLVISESVSDELEFREFVRR